jgi:hypothetical protein
MSNEASKFNVQQIYKSDRHVLTEEIFEVAKRNGANIRVMIFDKYSLNEDESAINLFFNSYKVFKDYKERNRLEFYHWNFTE